jgi:hypothetical protein
MHHTEKEVRNSSLLTSKNSEEEDEYVPEKILKKRTKCGV